MSEVSKKSIPASIAGEPDQTPDTVPRRGRCADADAVRRRLTGGPVAVQQPDADRRRGHRRLPARGLLGGLRRNVRRDPSDHARRPTRARIAPAIGWPSETRSLAEWPTGGVTRRPWQRPRAAGRRRARRHRRQRRPRRASHGAARNRRAAPPARPRCATQALATRPTRDGPGEVLRVTNRITM